MFVGTPTMDVLRIVLACILLDLTAAAVFNGSFLDELDNELSPLNPLNTRRKKQRSTSSSSKEKASDRDKDKKDHDSSSSASLLLSESSDSTSSSFGNTKKKHKKDDRKKYWPKSSKERKGWRKWHRKCTPCPVEMKKKWKDYTIKWICGGYQSARRSFKSLCMMHFRNCQDGTMFTKIADHRCQNASRLSPHGEHFFYDYKVKLSGESSSKSKRRRTSSSSTTSIESTSTESWDTDRHGDRNPIIVANIPRDAKWF